MMIFERDDKKPILAPSRKVLARELGRVWASHASLSDDHDGFIQAGGGNMTFVVEKRDGKTGKLYRASQENPVVPFEDGTELRFSGSVVKLQRNEWFLLPQVIELFDAFQEGRAPEVAVHWRDISYLLAEDGGP